MPDAVSILHHSGLSEYQITEVANNYGCQDYDQIVKCFDNHVPYGRDFIKRGKIGAVEADIKNEIDFIKDRYIKAYKEKNIKDLSPSRLKYEFQIAASLLNDNGDEELYKKAFDRAHLSLVKRKSDGEWVRDFFFIGLKEAYFEEKTRRKKGIEDEINDRVYYLPRETYYYLPKIFDENNPAILPDINTKTLAEAEETLKKKKQFTINKKEALKEIDLTLNFIKNKYKETYDKELTKQEGSFSSYPDSLKPSGIAYLFEAAGIHLCKKSKGNEELYEELLNDKKREKIKNANGREVSDHFFIQMGHAYKKEIAKQHWNDTPESYHNINDETCLSLPEIFSDDAPIIGKDKTETEEFMDKVVNIIKKAYKNMYKAGDYDDLSSKRLTPLFKQGASVIYKDERGIYSNNLEVFKAKEKEPAIDENGKKVKNGMFSTMPDYFYSLLHDAFIEEVREDHIYSKEGKTSKWIPDPKKVAKLPKIINRENEDLQLEEAVI